MNKQIEFISQSLEDLAPFVAQVKPYLKPGVALSLSGPMGAGKTHFVRQILQALGGDGVSSPTFALHQSYQSSIGIIDHLDLYRLENINELDEIGFWDLFSDLSKIIIVEWGDRLDKQDWPPHWTIFSIQIKVQPEGRRVYILKNLTAR